ncbi:MAG: hypothetical protein ACI4S4_07670 [Candidatus Ornithospirochaeta sp.]
MKNWYLIGMGVGLIIGVVAVIISVKSKFKGKGDFDERQIAARGESFMVGFWAMALANTLLSISSFFSGRSIFVTPEMGNLVAVIVGIGGFAIAAILKDAYFSLHEKKKPFFIFGAVITVMVGTGTVRFAMEGMLIEDGLLSDRSLMLFVLLLWLVIMAVQALHSRKKDDEE